MRCPRQRLRRWMSTISDVMYIEVAGTAPSGLLRVVCSCHPDRPPRWILMDNLVEL
jgi:hypothetical protein